MNKLLVRLLIVVLKLTTRQEVNIVNANRAGVLTSEFLVTILAQVVGVLVLAGVLSADQANLLNGVIGQAVKVIVDAATLIYMGKTAWEYIKGRNALKKAVLSGA